MNDFYFEDYAVAMTKDETIMRREEARAIQSHYDLGEVSAPVLRDFERACRACYPGDPYSCYLSDVSAIEQHCANGGMSDEMASAFYLDRIKVRQ